MLSIPEKAYITGVLIGGSIITLYNIVGVLSNNIGVGIATILVSIFIISFVGNFFRPTKGE